MHSPDNDLGKRAFCFIFLLCELVGGIIANSLAIMTDAAHLLSDIIGFMISILSMVSLPFLRFVVFPSRAFFLSLAVSLLTPIAKALIVVCVRAQYYATQNPTDKLSFGYHRAEILGNRLAQIKEGRHVGRLSPVLVLVVIVVIGCVNV